jgi:predicted DNA-binding protein (UPF0278 family)
MENLLSLIPDEVIAIHIACYWTVEVRNRFAAFLQNECILFCTKFAVQSYIQKSFGQL